MKTIFTLCLGCFCAALAAQPFMIQGSIVDAKTNAPLANANIYAPQNKRGTASDEGGRFSIELARLPDTLVISHLGFTTIRRVIANAPGTSLIFQLEPQSNILPEVGVSAVRSAEVIYTTSHSVVDYELQEGLPLLFVYKNSLSGYWLVALGANDEVLGELQLRRMHPEALVKSCLGGVYLLLPNGAYYVDVLDGKPVLEEQLSLQQYNQLILPCVAANDTYFYLRRWSFQNQLLTYEAVPRKGGAHLPIKIVADEAQIDRLRYEQMFRSIQIENAKEMKVSENRIMHMTQEESNFTRRIFYDPVQADLFAQGQRLCLFDHTNHYLEWLGMEGASLTRIPIQYHLDRKWKPGIISDAVAGRFYTLQEQGKQTLVLEINTQDGSTSERLVLDKPFVQNLQVFNGQTYFLYKDFAFNDRNLRLHRVK